MNMVRRSIARKYAMALLYSFGSQISRQDFFAISDLVVRIGAHRSILFFLKLSYIDIDTKEKMLSELLSSVEHQKPFIALGLLLMHSKRGDFLYDVLQQFIVLYQAHVGMEKFRILSASSLRDAEIQDVVSFLASHTKRDIIYDYTVDDSLIAGVRVQSDTLLWEHSIKKQLRDVVKLMDIKE